MIKTVNDSKNNIYYKIAKNLKNKRKEQDKIDIWKNTDFDSLSGGLRSDAVGYIGEKTIFDYFKFLKKNFN
jgi:hypothetical protein